MSVGAFCNPRALRPTQRLPVFANEILQVASRGFGVLRAAPAVESGVAARLLGTVPAVVLGGGVTLVVAATAAIRAPALRDLGALDQFTIKS